MESKEKHTTQEVVRILDVPASTLYLWEQRLGIRKQKSGDGRIRWISAADFERLREHKNQSGFYNK